MTESHNLKRRFIAGAVCPQCRALDRLVLESSADGSQQRRRCVACGFSESMDAPNASAGAMPRARFERSRAASVEHQPVKILDPSLTQRSGKNDD
ncbi:MAG: hypothetical protein CMP86_03440 [Gammaproteobacteria bacterium]|nr:hypothetical protein [Gammaproteobacteria bacterium]